MPRRRRTRRLLRLLPWLILPVFSVLLTAIELRLRGDLPVRGKPKPEVVWVFQAVTPGAIVSSPLVEKDRVYVGVVRDKGFSPLGAVVALDEASGKLAWDFDDGGKMIHMYSSPRLDDGRLYIGEGMHANFECKLYCIDIATQEKRWSFRATSHIESTPCLADGRVFFGAGDDGVYALDAATGKKLWQFKDDVHVDGSPVVVEGKVYVATAVSRRFKSPRVVCLDAATGKVEWQIPTDLPSWSAPTVDEGQLLVTLGNGRLSRSDSNPAGALLCIDLATRKRLWSRPVPDGIMAGLAVNGERAYFGCRDGRVYAVERKDGSVAWSYDAGSPVVTTPLLFDARLYVASSAGRVVGLNPWNGAEEVSFDLAAHGGYPCRVWSSPAARIEPGGRHRVYVGVELSFPNAGSMAVLYCLRF